MLPTTTSISKRFKKHTAETIDSETRTCRTTSAPAPFMMCCQLHAIIVRCSSDCDHLTVASASLAVTVTNAVDLVDLQQAQHLRWQAGASPWILSGGEGETNCRQVANLVTIIAHYDEVCTRTDRRLYRAACPPCRGGDDGPDVFIPSLLGLLAQHPQWEQERVDHRRPVHEDLVHGDGHVIPRVFRHVEVRCAVTILAELDRVDGVAAQSTHRAPFATWRAHRFTDRARQNV